MNCNDLHALRYASGEQQLRPAFEDWLPPEVGLDTFGPYQLAASDIERGRVLVDEDDGYWHPVYRGDTLDLLGYARVQPRHVGRHPLLDHLYARAPEPGEFSHHIARVLGICTLVGVVLAVAVAAWQLWMH